MDKEQIKQTYSMEDVVLRYGLHVNRAGFINCPFHSGDRSASLKIYPDSFYCFGCGAGGDIFAFVERMEGCDFKEAFVSLGGTYPEREKQDIVQTRNDRRRGVRDRLLDQQKKTVSKQESRMSAVPGCR